LITDHQAVALARAVTGCRHPVVLQRDDDHRVLGAGDLIVKCGHRDDFGVQAWACERARALGLPVPEVASVDTMAGVPHLVLVKRPGVPLIDGRLGRDVAERGARDAGTALRRAHEDRLPGFGWVDAEHVRQTGEGRGKSASWSDEVHAELEPALDALPGDQAAPLRAALADVEPWLAAVTTGQLLHGDLGRMHVLVDPDDGHLTGLIDWGDVQAGDPAWDLAVSACHFASPAEGLGGLHRSRHGDLFPHLLAGYDPPAEIVERLVAVSAFYLAYRLAWVARVDPLAPGVSWPPGG
jgi:aminoglycoside phosphotransferase (APT) family kinase protein